MHLMHWRCVIYKSVQTAGNKKVDNLESLY